MALLIRLPVAQKELLAAEVQIHCTLQEQKEISCMTIHFFPVGQKDLLEDRPQEQVVPEVVHD